MSKKKEYSVNFRIWIDDNNKTVLGIGRIHLLEKIIETGSITNASKELKMPYRKVWQIIKKINEHAEEPIVINVRGGVGGGGGSIVTDFGKEMMNRYYLIENKFKEIIENQKEQFQD